MKRMILAIGLVALALQSALAWRPAGWIFCREGASGRHRSSSIRIEGSKK